MTKMTLFPARHSHPEIDGLPSIFLDWDFKKKEPIWNEKPLPLQTGESLHIYVSGLTPALTYLIKYHLIKFILEKGVKFQNGASDYFDAVYYFSDKKGVEYDVTTLIVPRILYGLTLWHYDREKNEYWSEVILEPTEISKA